MVDELVTALINQIHTFIEHITFISGILHLHGCLLLFTVVYGFLKVFTNKTTGAPNCYGVFNRQTRSNTNWEHD